MLKKLSIILLSGIITLGLAFFFGCDSPSSDFTDFVAIENAAANESEEASDKDIFGLKYSHSLDTEYAKVFTVDYYEEGYVLLTVKEDDSKYLIVPEGKDIEVTDDVTIIKRPIENIYLVSSSSMDMFVGISALDTIKFSGRQADDWYIKEAADAMNEGRIVYAGKYSKPDYELIVSGGCDLAIENTMIYHSPDVLDQFKVFGIPYRMSIPIRIYDKHDYTVTFELDRRYFPFDFTDRGEPCGIAENARFMIDIAGGEYVFDYLDDDSSAKTTVNMQIEEFYKTARDADILIYNSSIDTSVNSLDDLYAKCNLLKDFKAVKEGNVWCTSQDMYQQSLSTAFMIEDFNKVFNDKDEGLNYLYRLK